MNRIRFRCYEELNEFLRPPLRRREFEHEVPAHATAKDAIEALGVPHTEVDLVLVDGEPVDFGYRFTDGQRVSVYPQFERLDINPLNRLRPRPLRRSRFLVDANLGKLARLLRLAGLDTAYRPELEDRELAALAVAERRILLSRDRDLLKRRILSHALYVHAIRAEAQLREVIRRLDLYNALQPFSRCNRCNGKLRPISKDSILERLQPATRRYYEYFQCCEDCARIYWQGGHFQRMRRLFEDIRDGATGDEQ